ncbi:hypothetical protein H5397_16830 [Propioniciclava sp. MC1683]|uniref:hypothetical protein n=1 Tax=Propioniciclava sp. MC1683 TaxID=2760309 RepID=UPI0016002890|nr:hypothetical protein [Propioniciclava sp. MC1683]MBB1503061.1 hypothetical protein [Propioniciclava sp. MC1683]
MPSSEVALSVLTVVVSIAGSWFVARWTVRAERASRVHAAAVDGLLPSLARLRALLHESSVRSLNPEDVARAVADFESLCLQHGASLPVELRSTQSDVRAAVGNYFGGVSLASLDARMATYPLSEPDPYWRDISISYIEYVMARLQQSLVRPKIPPVIHFSDWRRHEDYSRR